MTDVKNYYGVLGVAPNAEAAVIEGAYRALMKKYHPDARPGSDGRRVREINEAYSVLRDPNQRQAYDSQLRSERNYAQGKGTRPISPDLRGDPREDRTTPGSDKKRCPECAELVQAQARLCRYCGASFEEREYKQMRAKAPARPKRIRWWDWAILAVFAFAVLIYVATAEGPRDETATDSEQSSPPAVKTTDPQPPAAAHSQAANKKASNGRRTFDGTCKEGSHIAEGAVDEDLSNNRTPFHCDQMATSFDPQTGDVLFFFGSRRRGSPFITFSGGFDQKTVLTVEKVAIGIDEPTVPEEGFCRLFFAGGRDGTIDDLTDIVCGARIVQNGRAVVPKVVFSVRR